MKKSSSLCRLRGMVVFLLLLLVPSLSWAETRSLKVYYIHTREKAEIVYKKDGRYIDAGLKKLNHFLRDWRRNEPTKMDPRLFDLIWQVYQLSGSRDYIHVVSAYRSPATNNMLRSRSASSGVAKNSQHTLGKAMDFYLPDVNLAKLRGVGLRQEAGGVGYYPTSGSPFIHLDVGNVRHWPRMNRKELMALFPDGKTIHVPSDGKPLEGYNQALAAYNARKGALPAVVVASQDKKKNKAEKEKKSLFAGLFGKKNKEDKKVKKPVVIAQGKVPTPSQNTSQNIETVQTQSATQDSAQNTEVAQNEQTQVILPDTDVPIPAFSPLKQGHDNNNKQQDQDDAITALLVAQAEIEETAATEQTAIMPSLENSFVPVPILKKPVFPLIVEERQKITANETQLAHMPPLSRQNTPPPRLQIAPTLTQTPSSRPSENLPKPSQKAPEIIYA